MVFTNDVDNPYFPLDDLEAVIQDGLININNKLTGLIEFYNFPYTDILDNNDTVYAANAADTITALNTNVFV